MGFSPAFLDELRQRVALAEVIGRRVKLVRRGREFVGLCPFHNEKTPSFTVSEEKGFYHCFGCGAHGDVIRFLTEADGLSFPEAVERLAEQAGLALPQQSADDRRHQARRAGLIEANEAAAAWFTAQLRSRRGESVRRYLDERGLSPDTVEKFALGYAPPGRGLLKQALLAKGFDETSLIEAGLLIKPDDDKDSFDRFRVRLIFPIRDPRGRVVAFGGRALDDAPAKYLNSPETPLFHKGTTLYNLDLADRPARDASEVIVAEGYMDVIALAQAGFANSVAPLGTAVTEDHLRALWRLAPEPTLCFDGDAAGGRAALRAAERALAMLKAGYSLKFAMLPQGEDPDSLIQRRGAEAMQGVLDGALPLVDLLWQAHARDALLDTPERRARLVRDVMTLARDITDRTVQAFYQRELRNRLDSLFAREKRGFSKSFGERRRELSGSSHVLKSSRLSLRGGGPPTGRLEWLILATLVNHPELMSDRLEEVGSAQFAVARIDKAIRSLLSLAARDSALDSQRARHTLEEEGFAPVLAEMEGAVDLRRHGFLAADGDPHHARAALDQALARLRMKIDLEKERAEAEADLMKDGSEEAFERLKAVKAALADTAAFEIDFERSGG